MKLFLFALLYASTVAFSKSIIHQAVLKLKMWAQARVRVLTEDGLLVFLSAALVIQFELHLRAEKSSSSNYLSQPELRSSTLCLFHTRLCLGGQAKFQLAIHFYRTEKGYAGGCSFAVAGRGRGDG